MKGIPRWAAELGLVVTALSALGAADPRRVVVEVKGGPQERRGTPVVFPLPQRLAAITSFSLTRLDDGRRVDVQTLQAEGPAVAWVLEELLPAGATRRYRLEPTAPEAARPNVRTLDDGKSLRLEVGGRPVLLYHGAVVESPTNIEPFYRRSGQIHPVWTPSGRAVTDDFPPDHAHQHGVFFAWVNTTFEGRRLDFWNQKEQTGTVAHAEYLGAVDGPVYGELKVRLRHDDLSAPGGLKPVLNETWTVRAYNLSNVFVVDFESRQSCAGESALTVNQYHYGGFGLRGNRQWFDPRVKGNGTPDPVRSGRSDFLTSEGKTRRDGNHTRPRWVDLSGEVDGAVCGIAVLDHPANFRFPQPVRLHPNKPYFCFAPMVLGAFDIAPGKTYVSRYRLIAHDGSPDTSAIDRLWHDYADPPLVTIVTEP